VQRWLNECIGEVLKKTETYRHMKYTSRQVQQSEVPFCVHDVPLQTGNFNQLFREALYDNGGYDDSITYSSWDSLITALPI